MKHHLVIGTWTPPGRLYTVAFDDEALTLELVKKTDIPEDEPISWLTISVCIQALQLTFANAIQHDKKTLYGAAMKKWNSFAINSPTDIVHQVSHPLAGHRTHFSYLCTVSC
jgi:carboxy-cis,cis-muconate cyclase